MEMDIMVFDHFEMMNMIAMIRMQDMIEDERETAIGVIMIESGILAVNVITTGKRRKVERGIANGKEKNGGGRIEIVKGIEIMIEIGEGQESGSAGERGYWTDL